MIVSRKREKLIHSIIFFAQTTTYCHAFKLFKLLNFLDFEHYRQAGRPITSLAYTAWRVGPVPLSLYNEIRRGGNKDLKRAVSLPELHDQFADDLLPQAIEKDLSPRELEGRVEFRLEPFRRKLTRRDRLTEFHLTDELWWQHLKPKAIFKSKLFSQRELVIMERLAEFLRHVRGADMREFSQMQELPWRKVYGNGEGQGKLIPFELALEADPIISDAPTIDREEIQYRKELLDGLV